MFSGEEEAEASRSMKIELQEDFGDGDDGSYGGYYRAHEDIPSPGVGNWFIKSVLSVHQDQGGK